MAEVVVVLNSKIQSGATYYYRDDDDELWLHTENKTWLLSVFFFYQSLHKKAGVQFFALLITTYN